MGIATAVGSTGSLPGALLTRFACDEAEMENGSGALRFLLASPIPLKAGAAVPLKAGAAVPLKAGAALPLGGAAQEEPLAGCDGGGGNNRAFALDSVACA